MLTDTEWMIGIITFAYLIIGCILGMYFFYISKKTNARLLSYYSLAIIAGSLIYLAHAIDFLTNPK